MIVGVDVFKLIGRVYVKNKESVGVEVVMRRRKAFFKVAVLRKIVDAITTFSLIIQLSRDT